MVGFRKEIAREENLEMIPIGTGGGNVDLRLRGLGRDRPDDPAAGRLPLASIATTGSPTRIPEPGDIIRARWEQAGAMLGVRASYFDASAAALVRRCHQLTRATSSSLHGVNFNDGFHLASSITSDSEYYGIRRFRVGTLATYGQELPAPCPATLSPSSASVAATVAPAPLPSVFRPAARGRR